MLSLRNISKSYWRRGLILDTISIDFTIDEITALVGKNGAGKTSLLKVALGLLRPNKGEVWFQNENISRLPTHKRVRSGLGYMSQSSSAINDLSVENNLYLIPKMHDDDTEYRESLLTDFGLQHVRKSKSANLSGGELHKLEFCLCMATRPKVVLLDEPFAGLDPKAVKLLQQLIRDMHERGVGFVIVDHRINELKQLAAQYVLLNEKGIEFNGNASEFFESEVVRENFLG